MNLRLLKINQKHIGYPLLGLLIVIGIVYFVVANSEYQDYKELADIGIEGEMAEKQIEMTFFIAVGIINIGIGVWVLKVGTNSVLPYVLAIAVSIALIITYIASRTVGVPPIGIEYYVGRIDMISKVLQVLASILATFGIFNIKRSVVVKTRDK